MKSDHTKLKGLWLAFGLAASLQAVAATYSVTGGGDSGPGTLRQAILDANANAGADIISITASPITLTSALPTITDPVTITGQGATSTIIVGASGARIFDINSATGVVLIERLTIRGAGTGTVSGDGAGIRAAGAGNLNLSQIAVENNAASLSGGGLHTTSVTTISQSTFEGNLAATGGAISAASTNLTIRNSTISGNGATSAGGGLDMLFAQVNIDNSTLAYNTIPGASTGGAGLNVSNEVVGSYSLRNTLLAYNNAGSTDKNCGCSYSGCAIQTSGVNGFNIDTGNSCGFGSNNLSNASASVSAQVQLLEPLALNSGGTTKTHKIPVTSPALEYGKNTICNTLGVDQNGSARPADSDGISPAYCEAGAYETAANVIVPAPGSGSGDSGSGSGGGGGGGGGGCTSVAGSGDPVIPALVLAGLAGIWIRARRRV